MKAGEVPDLLLKNVELFRTHNTRPATHESYSSIFTRDKPGTADPRPSDALFAADSKYGNTIPNGTYLDMTTKLPLVDPKAIHAPVMMARGEYVSTDEDCLGFFQLLSDRDKQFVIVPGAAHSLVRLQPRTLLVCAQRVSLTAAAARIM